MLVLLLVAIVASTVYDAKSSNQRCEISFGDLSTLYQEVLVPDEPRKIFLAFSLRSNVTDLLKNETNTIGCLHGLRAISAFWVVGGHRIFQANLMTSKPLVMSPLGQAIIAVLMSNGYAVDVFFLVSGVLVAKSSLKSLDR